MVIHNMSIYSGCRIQGVALEIGSRHRQSIKMNLDSLFCEGSAFPPAPRIIDLGLSLFCRILQVMLKIAFLKKQTGYNSCIDMASP